MFMHRSKTLPELHSTSDDAATRPWKPSEIYVHYPTDDNIKHFGGIITLEILKKQKSGAAVVPSNVSGRYRWRQLPPHVQKLQQLRRQQFDQFTDGAMNLEERQLRQKRRESLPLGVGHLPVRARKRSTNMTSDSKNYDVMNTTKTDGKQPLRFPDMNKNTAPPTNLKIFLPKSKRQELSNEGNAHEQQRFQRLRQANELALYMNALQRTGSFLGRASSACKHLPQVTLNSEERTMLQRLRRASTSKRRSSSEDDVIATSSPRTM